ncbi:hypothetical protein V1477_018484 [Vespula maculifrons]|uniref:Uncharacterized protein n=1 Tax=Vespula maculifrons TaxID=7453 RepID=A0ABD2AVI0_VESMC
MDLHTQLPPCGGIRKSIHRFNNSTIHRINDNFNQLHDIIQPPTRGTSVLEPSQNFLSSE